MVHQSCTRSLGLVSALSIAALSVEQIGGFVHPIGGTIPVSSRQQTGIPRQLPSLSMSVSPPEDNFNSDNSNSVDREASSSADRRYTTDQYNGYDGAFPLPDDMEIPETRQLRWEREALLQSKFASGDQVFELRNDISALRSQLVDVREQLDDDDTDYYSEDEIRAAKGQITELENELLALNGRDAEFTYAVSLELLEKAQQEAGDEDLDLVKKYKTQVEEARLCIPQLNMHGLWVGK